MIKRIKKLIMEQHPLFWVTIGVGIFFTIKMALNVGDSFDGGEYDISLPFTMILIWFTPFLAGYISGRDKK